MMWARLIGSVLILGWGIGSVRSANESNDSIAGMDSCFRTARVADAICSKLSDDPARRIDCAQKTRSAQLECLERVLSETPAGPGTPKTPSEATRSEPPARAALPQGSSGRASPPAQTGTLETPARVFESTSPPTDIVGTKPPEPPGSTKAPTAGIRPDISPKTADVPVRTGTNWVISETTSPVDYRPLVTAMIRSTSQVKDAVSSLAVRCRGGHSELQVRTDGTWAATRGGGLRVAYQVNDQPAVGLQWMLSSDGKTATYKDDAVGLLQSLPDGARLKINVADRTSSSHEATFEIDGWDVVRNKIGTACKWAGTNDKTSSGKR
jgi:hypothetical protein